MNGTGTAQHRTPAAGYEADAERFAVLTDRCHRLVRFLREVALSGAPHVRDIDDHPLVVWLDDLPLSMPVVEQAVSGEVLLTVPGAVVLPPAPPLPDDLVGWVTPPTPENVPDKPPPLHELGLRPRMERQPDGTDRRVADTVRLADAPEAQRAYDEWVPAWNVWAARARADAERRALHGSLYAVAQRLAQEGDAIELVLATGLLAWQADAKTGEKASDKAGDKAGESTRIRHHLLSTKLIVEVDPSTSDIRLRLPADAATRLDDGPLLAGITAFRPERTNSLHERLAGRPAAPLGQSDERLLRDWLGLALDIATESYSPTWEVPSDVEARPRVTFAPAIVLRARGRAALLSYYDQMLDALRAGGRPPLGLVQLVETLEADDRLAWLAAEGAASGAQLGDDPLFPLPANPEQARVMERLRHDNGVVVEGPPGTGKTHTIANLVSALLAQGQRVLVTSQKAQALRVLRDKMPTSLQRLCVSLTDVTDGGSSELAGSISALAAEKAGYHPERHDRRIAESRMRRDAARARAGELADRVQSMRAAEYAVHGSGEVPPGWEGTLATVAARVTAGRGDSGWLPLPLPDPGLGTPLDADEACELLALLRTASPDRRLRAGQVLPAPDTIAPLARVTRLLDAERAATESALVGRAGLTGQVGALADRLKGMTDGQAAGFTSAVTMLGDALAAYDRHARRWPWAVRALDDLLAGRDAVLWDTVAAADPAVAQARAELAITGLHKIVLPPMDGSDTAEGLLVAGRALKTFLAEGGALKSRFKPKEQKDADPLLTGALVDGAAPVTPELLDLLLARLTAQVALEAAERAWSLVDVEGTAADAPAEIRIARLADLADAHRAVRDVLAARDAVTALLTTSGIGGVPLMSEPECRDLLVADDVVRQRARAARATEDLRRLLRGYTEAADADGAPPELRGLADAVADRDLDGYTAALRSLDGAGAQQRAQRRCDDLAGRLRAAHPELAGMLAATADDPVWDSRLAALPAAWDWARAATWVESQRSVTRESDLEAELDAAEAAVAAATAELAGACAWKHCLERMGAEQSAALRAYSDAIAAGGKFTGRYAERYRNAAREAMGIAQTAVPAWVMPLSEVLATIPAVRDCFDVVIVDEASQAGLDSLFLLWLAPRVIVVGDDRQCTPADANFGELEPVFHRLDTLLSDVPAWLRVAFTPRSSLFTLLRTRFGEVIRLREHFRCMPEIIDWSSAMFYRDAPLVPLRQFGADRLAPLRSEFVPGAETEGVSSGLRNRAEAEALVARVVGCAADPAYDGRSFGVVVLQGSAQADLIRALLIIRMPLAEQQRRRLRVGTPPDFQGDERDVVFLSLVVAPDTSTMALTRLEYQRRFNVAASRARDQVWLFHSVTPSDLDSRDLRHSYLTYVLSRPDAAAGERLGLGAAAPDLAGVRPDIPHPRFDTLFEQRVYLALRDSGYAVTPQVEVNGRRIDLVVAGGRARLAVECDGDTPPAVPGQLADDYARERELKRAGWRFWRVRGSEFAWDPVGALAPLWPVLASAGITPAGDATGPPDAGSPPYGSAVPSGPVDDEPAPWRPIRLSDIEGLDDAALDPSPSDPEFALRP